MTTLAEFLLARIAEDESAVGRGRRHNAPEVFANDNYGCLLVDPARVLAECDAKRRIVEAHPPTLIYRDDDEDIHACAVCRHADTEATDIYPCPTLRLLALPYADHADFEESWKP